MPSFPLAVVRVALLAGAALLATVPGPARADVHPTDTCVAKKLEAAGLACRRLFDARAVVAFSGFPGAIAARIAQIESELGASWQAAEDASAAAGVSCADTTVTSAAMADLLDGGVLDVASTSASAGPGGLLSGFGRYLRLRGAGLTCQGWLRAEGQHLVERGSDRESKRLTLERDVALGILRVLSAWSGATASQIDAILQSMTTLAQHAILAAIVSPNVPTAWTKVVPDTQIPYQGKTLDPICSGGTPYQYYVKRGTVNKLLVYYQGGGACWNYLTCGVLPVFKQTTGDGDNPANATTGFADLNNPANPFRDWNAVFIPYCTGDVHWGDAVVDHMLQNNKVTIHHKGRVNAATVEKWTREHFLHPEQVFVTGSSAGAYGAIMNGIYFKENVYPSSPFAILGDAGNGVITQDFLENEISKWGIQKNLPAWIPALNKPVTELSAADLWAEAALFYPRDRFANYATAFDGGNGGQTGFYQIMRNPGDISAWQAWWQSSCAWNEGMRAQTHDSAARAANYRFYIGSGSRHTMWGHPKVYTDTTGGVPVLVDWINGMLQGTPAWSNVECTDCGKLLPGDPIAPGTPPPAPFSADKTHIVCPNVP